MPRNQGSSQQVDSNLKVDKGQMTFDAEGKEDEKSLFYSRKAHVPLSDSGVTIGRGYDVKLKTVDKVKADFKAAGIASDIADKYVKCIGLKGSAARNAIIKNNLPSITLEQQKKLFEISYQDAEADVKRICEKKDVVKKYGATNWTNLDPRIKEMLIDLRFRGDYRPETRIKLQAHIAKNDFDNFKKAIEDKNLWLKVRNVPADRFERRKFFLDPSYQTPIKSSVLEPFGLPPDMTDVVEEELSKQTKFNPEEIARQMQALQDYYKKTVVPKSNNHDDTMLAADFGDDMDGDVADDEATTATEADNDSEEEPDSPKRKFTAKEIKKLEAEGINTFLSFVDDLGKTIKCKELRQGVTVIKGAIASFEAINTLVSLGSRLTVAAALGPIGVLGGVALTLFNLFSGGNQGPDPTELILDQIGRLSAQIVDLKDYLSENFKEIYVSQQQILEAIDLGFNTLIQEISDQVGSLRVGLDYRLNKIEGAISYTVRSLKGDIKELLIQEFRTYCHDVKNYLDGIYKDAPAQAVPKLSMNLYRWVVAGAAHPINTGYKVALDKPTPELLKEILIFNDDPDVSINSLIGFLANYYAENSEKYKSNINPSDIPNPQIWHDSIEQFDALMSVFFQLDNDPDNILLDCMYIAGNNIEVFIQNLSEDKEFWQDILNQYYQKLEKVFSLQKTYIEKYNEDILNQFNIQYQHQAIDPRQKLQALNVLDSPDTLINLFHDKSISKLASIENAPENRIGKLSNHMPFFAGLKNRHDLVSETLLCAEFLQIISFRAKQNNFTMPHILKTLTTHNGRNAVYYRGTGKGSFDHNRETNIIETLVGKEVLRKSADTNEEISLWIIPSTLQFICGDQYVNVCELYFKGGYDNLEVKAKLKKVRKLDEFKIALQELPDSVLTEITLYIKNTPIEQIRREGGPVPPTYHNTDEGRRLQKVHEMLRNIPSDLRNLEGEYETWFDTEDDGGYVIKLKNEIPKYVKECWEDANQLDLADTTTKLITDAQQNQVKTLIHQTFLEHRQNIATALLNKSDSATARQHILNKYQDKITNLDIHAKRIQLLLRLAGKDIADTPFEDLVNNEIISHELKKYIAVTDINNTDITPSLKLPTNETRITADDIFTLEDLDLTRTPHHPKRLFMEGINIIKVHKQKKELFRARFPNFSKYQDLQTYQAACFMYGQRLFAQETYEWLKDIDAKPFQTASFKVAEYLNHFSMPAPTKITSLYLTIYQWALDYACKPLVNGYQNKLKLDFSDHNIHLLLNSKLARGWEENVGLLMQIAVKLGQCKFNNSQSIVNFKMWGDGLESFMRLITTPELVNAAYLAGNTAEKQLQALERILSKGYELRDVFYEVCTSKKLFENLFANYSQVITELKNHIEELAKTKSDKKIYIQLNQKGVDAGVATKLRNAITTYASCIKLFCEEAFGYQLADRNNKFNIMLAEVLTDEIFDDFISSKNLSYEKKSLLERFKDAVASLNSLQKTVDIYQSEANELLCFSNYLIKFYNNKTVIAGQLVLDDKLTGGELSLAKAQLIAQVIKISPNISGLLFKKIKIKSHVLKFLLAVIKNCPSITSLSLCAAGLTKSAINTLVRYLPGCSTIRKLDLTGNNFSSQASKLIDLLLNNPNLIKANFADTQLNDTLYSMLAEHIRVGDIKTTVINLSNNLFTDDSEEVVNLFKNSQIPRIILQNEANSNGSSAFKNHPYSLSRFKPLRLSLPGMGFPTLDKILSLAETVQKVLEKRAKEELLPKEPKKLIEVGTQTANTVTAVPSVSITEKAAITNPQIIVENPLISSNATPENLVANVAIDIKRDWLDEAGIAEVKANNKAKEEFIIENHILKPSQLGRLIVALRANTSLKTIVLHNIGLNLESSRQLSEALRFNYTLKKLVVTGHSEEAITPFYDLILYNDQLAIEPMLEKLDQAIAGKYDIKSLNKLLISIKTNRLNTLSLNEFYFSDENCAALIKVLKQNISIKKIEITNCKLNEVILQNILPTIMAHAALMELNFNNNKITEGCLGWLRAASIKPGAGLRKISFAGNNFSDEDIYLLLTSLVNKVSSIEEINLSDNKAISVSFYPICAYLIFNKGIKNLIIKNIDIPIDKVNFIQELIKIKQQNQKIEELYTLEHYQAILQNFQQNLQEFLLKNKAKTTKLLLSSGQIDNQKLLQKMKAMIEIPGDRILLSPCKGLLGAYNLTSNEFIALLKQQHSIVSVLPLKQNKILIALADGALKLWSDEKIVDFALQGRESESGCSSIVLLDDEKLIYSDQIGCLKELNIEAKKYSSTLPNRNYGPLKQLIKIASNCFVAAYHGGILQAYIYDNSSSKWSYQKLLCIKSKSFASAILLNNKLVVIDADGKLFKYKINLTRAADLTVTAVSALDENINSIAAHNVMTTTMARSANGFFHVKSKATCLLTLTDTMYVVAYENGFLRIFSVDSSKYLCQFQLDNKNFVSNMCQFLSNKILLTFNNGTMQLCELPVLNLINWIRKIEQELSHFISEEQQVREIPTFMKN